MNASQQVTGDTTNLPFVRYCARVQRTAANTSTSTLEFAQALENTDSARFIGQTVTFSFYARKGANYSGVSSTLAAIVQTGTGTDQSWWNMTGTAQPISTSTTLTSTWQRFQYTATLSASATQVGFCFRFAGVGTAGAADYYEVTGVQLELGSIATPFAKMGAGIVQSELAACQRYYYRANYQGSTAYANFGTGAASSTTQVRLDTFFPVSLRVSPAAIDFPTVSTNFNVLKYDDTAASPTSVALDSNLSSVNVGRANWTVTTSVANVPYYCRGNNQTGAYLGWSAELS